MNKMLESFLYYSKRTGSSNVMVEEGDGYFNIYTHSGMVSLPADGYCMLRIPNDALTKSQLKKLSTIAQCEKKSNPFVLQELVDSDLMIVVERDSIVQIYNKKLKLRMY